MSERTAIEWCDSTFNPWVGCTKVSPACDHCYAEARMDTRLHYVQWGPNAERRRTSERNWRYPVEWNTWGYFECNNCGFRFQGERDLPSACIACGGGDCKPTRRRVFCASLADVFDNQVPAEWRAALFALIANTPNLDWLLLTKRIGNVAKMIEAPGMQKCGLPPNVWLGATICNQAEADRDIPKLLAVPARVRFLSIEPMLGPISIFHDGDPHPVQMQRGIVNPPGGLSWIICGGESGPGARPMHPDWARRLRDQCHAAGVPFLFKQWGEWCPRGPESLGYPPVDGVPRVRLTDAGHNGQNLASRGGNDVWMNRAGKKAAGRLLDGIEHNGFPA